MAKNAHWSSSKLLEIVVRFGWNLYLSDLDETYISSTYFPKILKYKISWKSVQWEQSCSMRADRPISFSQFCENA